MKTSLANQHRQWLRRDHRRKPERGELVCSRCGCAGNQECGHTPLAAPKHYCELDINDEGETGSCYCCRMLDEKD